MPTNPVSPHIDSAIDRLALGVDSPRGADVSNFNACMQAGIICFEAEALGIQWSLSCGVCGGPCCFEEV